MRHGVVRVALSDSEDLDHKALRQRGNRFSVSLEKELERLWGSLIRSWNHR